MYTKSPPACCVYHLPAVYTIIGKPRHIGKYLQQTAYISETAATLGSSTRSPGSQGQNQPTRAAQPSWAPVTGAVPQRMTKWTTVTNSKKKARKHSSDQRRNLLTLCTADGVCYTVTPQKYDRYISTLWSATIGVRAVRYRVHAT
jgi:hypothetical protein